MAFLGRGGEEVGEGEGRHSEGGGGSSVWEEIQEAKVAGAAFAKLPGWQDVRPTAAGAPKAVGLQVLSWDQLRAIRTPLLLVF